MRALHPMTDEERAVAEEWHPLVFEFLHSHRLREQDYYDVAVFGFIAAVQYFVANGTPEGVSFITMAKRTMMDAVIEDTRYNARKKRSGVALSLDYELAGTNGLDWHDLIADDLQNPQTQAESKLMIAAACAVASLKEAVIIPFVARGHTAAETARRLGITASAVESRLYRFRRKARVATG